MHEKLGDRLKHIRDRDLPWSAAPPYVVMVALDVEDVEFIPKRVLVTVLRSKTKQEGQNLKIVVPYSRT